MDTDVEADRLADEKSFMCPRASLERRLILGSRVNLCGRRGDGWTSQILSSEAANGSPKYSSAGRARRMYGVRLGANQADTRFPTRGGTQ